MTWRIIALALCVALLLLQSSSAPPRVAIVRATAFAFDDEAIVIMVQVEPYSANRALIVSAVDEGVAVRSSLEALAGDRAPRTRWVRWGHLPAGDLVLVAALFESQPDAVARATKPIQVIARR
jgi:hypothetical protein